ncbi:MAG TPA: hypothetical protein VGS21_07485, partial [Acidimicrobiales bacterium]|nr:hypothetical protein [Acidimicrobiales bacterium]
MEEEALPVGDEGAREAADIAPEVADMPPEADDQAPDSVEGAPGRIERPRGYRVALVLHLASLAAALVVLLVINRHMWFRGDDFDFLSQRGLHGATYSLWYPHNVHWSTVPILIWRGLFYFAGLRTAVPYLLVLYLANLLLAHLVWRVMLSSGAGPFVATGGCCMLLLFGPGAENLIWAFQIGFVLSLVGGFAMTALGDGSPSLRRLVPAGLLGVPMMMTSAIA